MPRPAAPAHTHQAGRHTHGDTSEPAQEAADRDPRGNRPRGVTPDRRRRLHPARRGPRRPPPPPRRTAPELKWAPFKGPAELLTSVPEPCLTLGAVGLGTLLGLLLAFLALHESLSVRITDDLLVLTVRDTAHEIPRQDVASAHRDGKQLVLLAHDGTELAREDSDLPWNRLSTALTAHGYRWAPQDPHRDAWRRWVPGTPGLPAGADALLKARAGARRRDDADEARELREELRRLGVTVRDEKNRQYWRSTVPQS
ncbi:YqeB family protein [Streptomyces composti]|uniref:YqeB family protein n=1 Tax=Streptomyces composti TaxID=2720025 RepID=UPI001F0FCDBC|nr:hypothetical protein [Streptomyces composti]